MTTDGTVRAYFRAWAIYDEAERLALLDQCWTDRSVRTDPYSEVVGRQALSNHIDGFHRNRPGVRFLLASGTDAHHGVVRYRWVARDASGQLAGDGISFGELAPDGRLQRVTVFYGPFPDIPEDWPADEVWRGGQ